jgi:hypothetical protein
MASKVFRDVVEAVENGRPIDYVKTARLQTLAMVQAGDRFSEDMAQYQEDADARFEQLIAELAGG